jgi:hypothetical protein
MKEEKRRREEENKEKERRREKEKKKRRRREEEKKRRKDQETFVFYFFTTSTSHLSCQPKWRSSLALEHRLGTLPIPCLPPIPRVLEGEALEKGGPGGRFLQSSLRGSPTCAEYAPVCVFFTRVFPTNSCIGPPNGQTEAQLLGES